MLKRILAMVLAICMVLPMTGIGTAAVTLRDDLSGVTLQKKAADKWTGQRVERLFELVKFVSEQNSMRIKTGMLNDVLAQATARVQPPTDKGKRLRIYYMTQASTNPPTFVFFVNRAELFHFSYQRYIENCLRETYGFSGTPIKLIIKQRGDDPNINVKSSHDKQNDEAEDD